MYAVLDHIQKIFIPYDCPLSTQLRPCARQERRPPSPPDLPVELWLEIFQFATYVQQSHSITPDDPFIIKRASNNVMGVNSPSLSMRTKLSLVLVCRAWRNVALQMLYQHLVIRSPPRAKAVLSVLRRSSRTSCPNLHPSHYGRWTRHIEIYTHARRADSTEYLQTIFQIMRLCPNLRILNGTWNHPFPAEFLNAVTNLYSSTLEGLRWNEQVPYLSLDYNTVASPEFLASFPCLHTLDLRNFVGTDLTEPSQANLSSPCLPRLQNLIISTNGRSIAAATALHLPSLQRLTIKTSSNYGYSAERLTVFLKVHGRSLASIDIHTPSTDNEPDSDNSLTRRVVRSLDANIFFEPNMCPNLIALTIPTSSPLLSHAPHNSLRRIGLRGVRADGLYPDKQSTTRNHLLSFTPSRFPNLELVRTVGFLVDADSDYLIKDIFIWWVERFEKNGIDFLDGEGVLWAYDSTEGGNDADGRTSSNHLG